VAKKPYASKEEYIRQLETRLSRTREVMHVIFDRAKADPKRIVFPEGEDPKIVMAAKTLVAEKLCRPILIGDAAKIGKLLLTHELDSNAVEVIDPESSEKFDVYAGKLHTMRWRNGVTMADAMKKMRDPVYFGNMMVHEGDADGLISGLTMNYPETIRPALQIHATEPGMSRVAGVYALLFEDRILFIADTTVNVDPTAEELAEIARLAADLPAMYFGEEPRIAMLSYSNFGSNRDERTNKVRRATEIVRERWPELVIEGEMQADTAVEPSIAAASYPFSTIKGDANVLVCPDLEAANIAYKLLWRMGKVEAIGPILSGLGAPVHVLQRGVDVSDIVNMAAICVLKAQRYR
jgi:malate dehydrogenase (oxaloacetate-decarboxylating)(NADP+)